MPASAEKGSIQPAVLPAQSQGILALSAAVNMRGGFWGLIARSTYVEPKPLKRSIFHNPDSLGHFLLQLCATIPLLRTIGYYITFRVAYTDSSRKFIDDAFGYTFFEDGNRRVRRVLHALGLPSRIAQQTFMIPYSNGHEPGAMLAKFMKAADDYLAQQGLDPALVDVLYVGRDDDQFLLSSSSEFDAFAVTFTFERLFRSLDKERASLVVLSRLCRDFGGRVHLGKNVYADIDLICDMYNVPLTTLRSLREKYEVNSVLRNDFAKRVLRGI
jgi:hypothetical protein